MSKKYGDGKGFFVWFDTEYSDLKLEKAHLLQVAALVTDASLRRVLPAGEDVILAIRLPIEIQPSPWVEENLSELLRLCRSPDAVDLADADQRLADYVDKAAGTITQQQDQRPVLAGNSIHADWWLVRRFLPQFLSRLHYRHLDVTTFKLEWQRLNQDIEFDKENSESIRQYFPEAVLPVAGNRHDAYYDLQASLSELAFYRAHLLQNF
ncbi:MAG: hypothetical protein JXA41_08725 [Deltaproteobacteria bacterium]|nr:hypothetical protein [Deltaproteobacteria bacterium]